MPASPTHSLECVFNLRQMRDGTDWQLPAAIQLAACSSCLSWLKPAAGERFELALVHSREYWRARAPERVRPNEAPPPKNDATLALARLLLRSAPIDAARQSRSIERRPRARSPGPLRCRSRSPTGWCSDFSSAAAVACRRWFATCMRVWDAPKWAKCGAQGTSSNWLMLPATLANRHARSQCSVSLRRGERTRAHSLDY